MIRNAGIAVVLAAVVGCALALGALGALAGALAGSEPPEEPEPPPHADSAKAQLPTNSAIEARENTRGFLRKM